MLDRWNIEFAGGFAPVYLVHSGFQSIWGSASGVFI